MCGIVGVLGKASVADHLVDALKRLEDRGYDLSGVATLENGHIERRRAEGKLCISAQRSRAEPLPETPVSGIRAGRPTAGRAKRTHTI